MRIAIGSDHGGYELKTHLAKWLGGRGLAVQDCGTFDGATADYPVIAAEVARQVASGSCARGIMIDGAGIGSSMAANKIRGVRAALCYDVSSARNSREHNDANVLTLGARLIGTGLAEQIVDVFLTTECTEERHKKRVAMIGELERGVAAVGAAGVCGCECGGGATCPCGGHSADKGAGSEQRTVGGGSGNVSGDSGGMNLSSEDLDRIAQRIAEMAGRGHWPAGAPCACCGADCHGHCAEKNPSAVRNLIDMGAGRIAFGLGGGPIAQDVAKFIDHTLLKPEATRSQVEQLCREAAAHHFASVCINPTWVSLCASMLRGTDVKVCTVVGFPLGAHTPDVKAFETRRAIRDGAREIDMVINIGALKSGDDELVFRDIKAVVDACVDGRAICKVIIECALLTDEEKVRACVAARRARADFVKTSTGFSSGGATAADVALMAEAVRGTRMGVKAAGGIRSYEDLRAMVQAGATRIGASAGVAILKEARGETAAPASSASSSAKEKY
ncbi:MAG: hypothetical protein HBSAPP02_20830 [Phycisphaerae bacterium]|nr:MAG: hypothetical protein DCC66_06920 [Planctomycetota bacterium]GJQ27051.1 MAG: hypothetical protein HBSAPP02_20830 [Phycisphaerae bacterium]